MKENITKRIDKSVTLSLLVTFLVFAALLAFRVADFSACPAMVDIKHKGNKYEVEELIQFNSTTKADDYEWDFGDGTTTVRGNNLYHKYKKPGEYEITLRVNNSCYGHKLVTINPKEKDVIVAKPPKLPEAPKVVPATIIGATRVKVNTTYHLKDGSPDSKKWKWSFGDNYQADPGNKRKAKHVYRKAGTYTIKLKTDNGEDTKKVIVYNTENPCPVITGEQFRNMLNSLATSNIQKEHFDDYLTSNFENQKNVKINFYTSSNIKKGSTSMNFNGLTTYLLENYRTYTINVEELYKTNINCIQRLELKLTEKLSAVPEPVVTVKASKPVEPEKPKPETPTITERTDVLEKLSVEDFTKQITSIYEGNLDPTLLERFICSKTSKTIIMNDGKERMSYEKFVLRLQRKGLRMRKIEVTDLYYDEETNCINKVKFNYRR